MNSFASPAVQAMNLIRYIGDEVSKTGKPINRLPDDLSVTIGAPSSDLAFQLVEDLIEEGILSAQRLRHSKEGSAVFSYQERVRTASELGRGNLALDVSLTLKGWERYETEKRGEFKGNSGFIAMQFGDPDLDPFVKDVVKPAVKEGIGYDLVDMRDVGRAGVIDNIMRTQIRDAAFVIVDLTHDNSGAYWEAGYAEGLGKPVLYICEKTKFDEKKTHFDTNHCTTVPWSREDDEGFKQALIATLRRSLNL